MQHSYNCSKIILNYITDDSHLIQDILNYYSVLGNAQMSYGINQICGLSDNADLIEFICPNLHVDNEDHKRILLTMCILSSEKDIEKFVEKYDLSFTYHMFFILCMKGINSLAEKYFDHQTIDYRMKFGILLSMCKNNNLTKILRTGQYLEYDSLYIVLRTAGVIFDKYDMIKYIIDKRKMNHEDLFELIMDSYKNKKYNAIKAIGDKYNIYPDIIKDHNKFKFLESTLNKEKENKYLSMIGKKHLETIDTDIKLKNFIESEAKRYIKDGLSLEHVHSNIDGRYKISLSLIKFREYKCFEMYINDVDDIDLLFYNDFSLLSVLCQLKCTGTLLSIFYDYNIDPCKIYKYYNMISEKIEKYFVD